MSSSAGSPAEKEFEDGSTSYVYSPVWSLVGGLSSHKSTIDSTTATINRLSPKVSLPLILAPLPGEVIESIFFLEPTGTTT